MEYEEPLITCDRVLELFTKERPANISHGDINNSLGYKNGDPDSSFVLAALDKLTTDNYLIKYGDGSTYKISGETFTFKRNGSYKGLIERENRKAEIKEAIEQLGLKSTQSVIDTNTSIQTLNRQTGVFYEKQTTYNNTQKFLTAAILFSSVLYTVIAGLSYYNTSKQEQSLQQSVQDIKTELNNQAMEDSIFQKRVKDSLKMK